MITSHRTLASDGFLPSTGPGIDSIAGGTPIDRHFHTSTSPPPPSSFQSLHPLHHNHHFGSHPGGFPPTIDRSTTQRTIAHLPRASSARHHTSPPIPHHPTDLPISSAIALYRSISADSAPPASQHPTQNSSSNLVQRLAQQNAAIREAWEAERTYLEANRRRAEEVYQEERVIMDEVREGWESEKATMLRENEVLRERVHRLEGENHALLKAMATQAHTHSHISGVVSPQASLRGDSSLDTSTNASAASGPSALTGYPFPAQTLDRAAPAHHGLAGHGGGSYNGGRGSSRTSPTGQPESSPFIPLDPRMQTQAPVARDFLSPTDEPDAAAVPVPVIDVQEVDPKLEGIPLKATAVQKATFGAGDSHTPSPVVSPPVTQIRLRESQDSQEQHQEKRDQVPSQLRPEGKRASSKEHTIQVLQAEASRRLTMHAGHTPNHSLSRFPTMSIAASSTGAAADDETSGQASTGPYSASYSAPYAPTEPEEPEEVTLVLPPVLVDEVAGQAVLPHDLDGQEGHPEALLVAEEDVALRGPLMIRNIPAQDEIFWDQVNKKLEPISQGMDALPTVMRASVGDDEAAGPLPVVVVGGDAAQDASVPADALPSVPAPVTGGGDGEGKRVEGEIALKFRTTTNFGAPFGVA